MIKAVMVVPRVETKLYSEWVSKICVVMCILVLLKEEFLNVLFVFL